MTRRPNLRNPQKRQESQKTAAEWASSAIGDPTHRLAAAYVMMELEDWDAAMRAIVEYGKAGPSVQATEAMAELHARRGDWPAVMKLLDGHVQSSSLSWRSLRYRSLALLADCRFEEYGRAVRVAADAKDRK